MAKEYSKRIDSRNNIKKKKDMPTIKSDINKAIRWMNKTYGKTGVNWQKANLGCREKSYTGKKIGWRNKKRGQVKRIIIKKKEKNTI